MNVKQKYEELFTILDEMNIKELAKYFNCEESDICLDDITDEFELEEIPFKVLWGDLNLTGQSNVESLGNLEAVLGSVNIGGFSKLPADIESLGKLKVVTGDLRASFSNLEDLGNLVAVGGTVDLEEACLKSTGKLEFVGEDLYIRTNDDLNDASSLKYVGGDLDSQDTRINSFDNLEYVGGEIEKDADTKIDASVLQHGKIK